MAPPVNGAVFILAGGTAGDLRPLGALAAGLKRRGYPIQLMSAVHDRPLVEATGLDPWREWLPVPMEYDREWIWLRDPRGTVNEVDRRRMHREFELGMRRGLAAVADHFRAGTSIRAVVSSTAGLPFLILLAASRRLPYFQAGPMPYTPTRAFMMDRRRPRGRWFGWENWFRWRRALNQSARALLRESRFQELRALADPRCLQVGFLRRYYTHGIHHLVGVSPTVFRRPRDWTANMHVTGYCHLPWDAGWAPPADLCAFVEAGPPPLYVGFGSYAFFSRGRGRQLLDAIVTAVGRAGHRAVIQTGPVEVDQRGLPDYVKLCGDIPHAWLFPRCSAVLHHGGGGTFHTCLEAGKPMIAYPCHADQFLWAELAAELGVAPPSRATIFEVSSRVVEDDLRYLSRSNAHANARRLGKAMANDPDGTQVQVDIMAAVLDGPVGVGARHQRAN